MLLIEKRRDEEGIVEAKIEGLPSYQTRQFFSFGLFILVVFILNRNLPVFVE